MVNGIQKAIKDYSDELKHVGTAAGQATTRILQSTEDALTQFFTTGKLNARSLIDTIIAGVHAPASGQAVDGVIVWQWRNA